MTTPKLKLYDTLTREKREFTPIDPKNVGMYVCGVTPYDDSHIGHARVYVVFDVFYRLLKHLYENDGGKVTYVRNFTDIDDKIIERAQQNGEEPTALSERFIQEFYADMDALHIERPTYEPRVSTSMPQIVEMIDDLLAQNKAYVTVSGDVMFDVPAFEKVGGHQPFGTLARRTFDKLQARVEGDEEKRDPRDFPIWKANAKSTTKLDQAFHPDQLGARHFTAPGRPGWHIECSVMSKQHLGPTFDIHGGGEDLQFPHHCCEIAQSEALLPAGQPMTNYWLHNGFITVNGTKMSKSLGNFTTIKDALQKYSPEAIRLWLLQTHYRKPVDYSDEALQAAQTRYEKYRNLAIQQRSDLSEEEAKKLADSTYFYAGDYQPSAEFLNALVDDLNTPQAIGIIEQTSDPLERLKMFAFLGVNLFKVTSLLHVLDMSSDEKEVFDKRAVARQNKDWKLSDELRDQLKAMGILVEDGPTGQTWRRA